MQRAEPCQFRVNGYQLAGLRWRSGNRQRIIALHGWLDNAASFSLLAPQLTDCDVVALDLGGNGFSDHKSPQASYNLWDDLADVLGVADRLGWSDFALLGHSRGAMMATLLAAAEPQRVSALYLLDGLLPQPVADNDFIDQFQRCLRKQRRLHTGRAAGYLSLAQAVAARQQLMTMSSRSAEIILQRNLVQGDGRWYWRTDPRLRNPSAVKLNRGQVDNVLASLRCPTFLMTADDGLLPGKLIKELIGRIDVISHYRLPGNHYFHMEQSVAVIAKLLSSSTIFE